MLTGSPPRRPGTNAKMAGPATRMKLFGAAAVFAASLAAAPAHGKSLAPKEDLHRVVRLDASHAAKDFVDRWSSDVWNERVVSAGKHYIVRSSSRSRAAAPRPPCETSILIVVVALVDVAIAWQSQSPLRARARALWLRVGVGWCAAHPKASCWRRGMHVCVFYSGGWCVAAGGEEGRRGQ